MHATTGFPTVMKPSKTSISQFYEIGQGSPVTTWANILSCRPRSSSNEAANHKHEHQTCYLLVAASKVYAKVHDNKVGVLTCPRLVCNKNCKSVHHEISESKISDDNWNCRQSHCHSKIRLPKKFKEVKGSAKGSAAKPCMRLLKFVSGSPVLLSSGRTYVSVHTHGVSHEFRAICCADWLALIASLLIREAPGTFLLIQVQGLWLCATESFFSGDMIAHLQWVVLCFASAISISTCPIFTYEFPPGDTGIYICSHK